MFCSVENGAVISPHNILQFFAVAYNTGVFCCRFASSNSDLRDRGKSTFIANKLELAFQ